MEAQKIMILPLSPSLCFVHESEMVILRGGLSVSGINQLMIAQSSEYYFGRYLPEIELA
jgi:hypothetical protein